jgi:hypothetical protein
LRAERGDCNKDLSPGPKTIPDDLRFTNFVTSVDRIR